MLKMGLVAALFALAAGSATAAVIQFDSDASGSADQFGGASADADATFLILDSTRRRLGFASADVDAGIDGDVDTYRSEAFVSLSFRNELSRPQFLHFDLEYDFDGSISPRESFSEARSRASVTAALFERGGPLIATLFEDGFRRDTDASTEFGVVPTDRSQPLRVLIDPGQELTLEIEVVARARLEDFASATSEARADLFSTSVTPVPAPAALPLLLGALAGLALMRRRP